MGAKGTTHADRTARAKRLAPLQITRLVLRMGRHPGPLMPLRLDRRTRHARRMHRTPRARPDRRAIAGSQARTSSAHLARRETTRARRMAIRDHPRIATGTRVAAITAADMVVAIAAAQSAAVESKDSTIAAGTLAARVVGRAAGGDSKAYWRRVRS